MNKLSTKDFIGLKDAKKSDIKLIIDTALTFREVLKRPIKKIPSLKGKNIVNLFFENSTRTKLSFELAEKRLSADVMNFAASSSSLNKGESLRDTVQNIQAMKIDCAVMRHPVPGSCYKLTQYLDCPIINAGDGTNEHPTQAMLDITSIYEKFGKIKNLKVSIVGDILHSRVAMSNILGLQKMGAKVLLCAPPHLIPKFMSEFGVNITHDINEALEWSDALNILRIQRERMGIGLVPSIKEYRDLFGITKDRLQRLNKEVVIMHPGPINRGVEIDTYVADSDQSIILNQVLNGVAVRMSILYLLLGATNEK